MEQGFRRSQRDYSLAFKLSVVEQVEKGEMTYKQAQMRYGIQGRSTVLVWCRKHGLQDWTHPRGRSQRSAMMTDKPTKPLTPEQRIKELERELRRKDAALAETAALLVLKKKAEAWWGDADDTTDPTSER